MEVHHHPELPHGEKKRFKEYVLEFLMIFLAVTMGFIAENIREHLSDNAKESEYITGMIKNLGVDTIRLKEVIKETDVQIKGFDSLINVSKNKLVEIPVQDSLYLMTSRYIFYANDFKNDDITLTQLRNAGGYRLIKDNNVLDSIAEYESRIKDIDDEFNGVVRSLEKARDNANFIFDLHAGHVFKFHPTSTPLLITNDKVKIYNYYNSCWYALLAIDGYEHMLKEHLKYTTHLIAYLKKGI
ncbi:hypothetical protein [Mucilaginibacter gotjawali]|uniref:Uncharacterized protein n=2 Tax=Mucilaginibacter gotjawali TaxID=1550579 RepID=A0A839SGT4_9SPHI|nr:hypothetical protein [Mucilaginibacter gotjawali]MBB3056100.1 hypothetical protein [Mucilaginibacter gotjawali]BAU53563.1 hypothetical protein MgSA37_01732 [Mucilaginibacter gotjawali]